jgi:ABC-type polysaccharide/polyol phosphate transport system ATPase subunit
MIAGPRADRFVERCSPRPWNGATGSSPNPAAVTTFLGSHDAQKVRSLCGGIGVIANGRVVFTGGTRELGTDLDTFEKRLIQLLTRT